MIRKGFIKKIKFVKEAINWYATNLVLDTNDTVKNKLNFGKLKEINT